MGTDFDTNYPRRRGHFPSIENMESMESVPYGKRSELITMRTRVKFCGITSSRDAECAVLAGADALGFVFFKESPRYIKPESAEGIIKDLPPFVTVVGVFVNEALEFIEECIERCGLNAVQLHGDEDARYCLKFKSLEFKAVKLIKAIRVKDKRSLSAMENCPSDIFLLDTYKSDIYGGTGKGFERSLAVLAKEYTGHIIISGGLTPDNVYGIIKEVCPYGVDVSSGIESGPGSKDKGLMERFMKEVRRAEREE